MESVWQQVLDELADVTAAVAGNFESLKFERDTLTVVLKTPYDRDLCCRPERKQRLEHAVEQSTGKKIRLDFQVTDEIPAEEPTTPKRLTRRQRVKQVEQQSFIRSAMELFDVEITDVQSDPDRPAS